MDKLKDPIIQELIKKIITYCCENIPQWYKFIVEDIWHWWPWLVFQLSFISLLQFLVKNDIAQSNLQYMKGLAWIDYMATD